MNKFLLALHSLLSKVKTQTQAILLTAAFIMLTGNHALFGRILEVYPAKLSNLPFLASLVVFFSILTTLFLLAISHGRFTRWVLAFFLFAASLAAYYMDQFGVIVDVVMLDNIAQTNPQEFAGLVTPMFILRAIFFGVIPAWLAIKYTPAAKKVWPELKSRLLAVAVLLLLLIVVIVPFTAGYTSFIREHRVTRFYANPTYFTYSLIKYVQEQLQPAPSKDITRVALDAKNLDTYKHHELIIMVVGETARADRFSLNGYEKLTNPLLAKENVVSFSNVSSCGTSTGVSVPCMFSVLGREKYDKEKALHTENALDVLFENKVQILWRDNNSDSKGVATRLKYENFKTPTLNPVCDKECRDIGMLSGLDKYIEARKDQDILIVLHQMGNHGPEYYRRYPAEFERFKPMCMTGELRDCSQEEIDNSYDNAILYTDYFLSEVIQFLKKYDDTHETAMLYVSDHGESLGEHGLYLHAAPYSIAPKEQTHVPAIVWMGKNFDFTVDQAKPFKDYPLSHDDVFCTLLVAFEMQSKTCESKQQILMQNNDLRVTH
ncbi:phosphoethanolamine transferase [Methylotenera versatilis]|uniref:phosphoethanolamine transferase n=1 Tax=Methylotenera versatilis TaxID=1055487 RepID=UPI000648C0D4|nr:phosphoethanolamine--lipid A transferase [Methylotenera versatilis]